MQMRSPGLKPSAVTIHARRLSASITADRSPRKKNVPFGLLGCGNFRTSSKGDSGARAVALQAEECDKRLYLLPPPPPRHVPGWTQLRTLALISVTRRSSPDRTEQTAACHAGADAHSSRLHTQIFTHIDAQARMS